MKGSPTPAFFLLLSHSSIRNAPLISVPHSMCARVSVYAICALETSVERWGMQAGEGEWAEKGRGTWRVSVVEWRKRGNTPAQIWPEVFVIACTLLLLLLPHDWERWNVANTVVPLLPRTETKIPEYIAMTNVHNFIIITIGI